MGRAPHLLEVPAWTCTADGRILDANLRAEALFGACAAELRGQHCSDYMAGEDADGSPWCLEGCSFLDRLRVGEQLAPVELRLVNGPRSGRWLLVVPIPLDTSADERQPPILFVALDVHRARRIENYLERVATRSGPATGSRLDRLTPRETEILSLLAADLDSHAVARHLHLSYATVRNHVQRILARLEVHAIQEAIAFFLLRDSDRSRPLAG